MYDFCWVVEKILKRQRDKNGCSTINFVGKYQHVHLAHHKPSTSLIYRWIERCSFPSRSKYLPWSGNIQGFFPRFVHTQTHWWIINFRCVPFIDIIQQKNIQKGKQKVLEIKRKLFFFKQNFSIFLGFYLITAFLFLSYQLHWATILPWTFFRKHFFSSTSVSNV